MKSKESEYRELFLVEALENFEELNKLFIDLEKKHDDQRAINSIFRIVHTLKGNSMGMGFDSIAGLTHVMEDVMGYIKNRQLSLNAELFEYLFRANDKLGELIKSLDSGKKVSYLGIKTKLEVLLKNSITELQASPNGTSDNGEESVPSTPTQVSEEEQEEPQSVEEDAPQQITFADVIQIPVKKMDELMNLVGQLVIERDRLIALDRSNGSRSEFEGLKRISSNLQYGIMNARMVQMGFLFNKFHRIVRDAATVEKKQVNLVLKGTEVEIDRNILKVISDALIHLARNAVSHGIEKAADRKNTKKDPIGTIILDAQHERDNVAILMSDDGHGIDPGAIRRKVIEKGLMSAEVAKSISDADIIMQIFQPGFSNAEKITEISGRGVGMDVVKKAVESIGGQVMVETEVGKGTTIKLLLPSSLALKGALLFTLAGQAYAVALSYTEAVISLQKKAIHKISTGLMAQYLEQTISIVFLKDLIEMKKLEDIKEKGKLHETFDSLKDDPQLDVIIVSYGGKLTGIVIDKLMHQQEIMEKTLPAPLEKTRLLSGTTILGNGTVCPVLDIAAISDLLFKHTTQSH